MNSRWRREELEFQVCPYCRNDKWNFTVNVGKGLWHTWCCSRGGRLSQIRHMLPMHLLANVPEVEPLGLVDHRVVLEGCSSLVLDRPEALWLYFLKRGFGEEEAWLWDVMYRKGTDRLVFPFMEEGWCKYYVEKEIGTGAWHCPVGVAKKGVSWIKFGNPSSRQVVLVEGVFDGMRIVQAGFNALILMGTVIQRNLSLYLKSRELTPVVLFDSDVKKEIYLQLWKCFEKDQCLLARCPVGKDPSDLSIREVEEVIGSSSRIGLREYTEMRLMSR